MLQEWIEPALPLESIPRLGNHRVGICPVCEHYDMTEKVTSIARRHAGVIYLPDTSEEVAFMTGLGRTLSFPSPPRPVTFDWMFTGVIVSWLMAIGIMVGIALLRGQDQVEISTSALDVATFATVGWFGLAVPLWIVRRFVVENYRSRVEKPSWVAAKDRWDRMYYCARDDVVFLRDDVTTVAPEHVNALLQLRPARVS